MCHGIELMATSGGEKTIMRWMVSIALTVAFRSQAHLTIY